MASEETDFERKPFQKQFRVSRNSYNSKRGAQGLLGEGGPLISKLKSANLVNFLKTIRYCHSLSIKSDVTTATTFCQAVFFPDFDFPLFNGKLYFS